MRTATIAHAVSGAEVTEKVAVVARDATIETTYATIEKVDVAIETADATTVTTIAGTIRVTENLVVAAAVIATTVMKLSTKTPDVDAGDRAGTTVVHEIVKKFKTNEVAPHQETVATRRAKVARKERGVILADDDARDRTRMTMATLMNELAFDFRLGMKP